MTPLSTRSWLHPTLIELEKLAHTAHSLGALLEAGTPNTRSPSWSCTVQSRSRTWRMSTPGITYLLETCSSVRLPVICQLSASYLAAQGCYYYLVDNTFDTLVDQ